MESKYYSIEIYQPRTEELLYKQNQIKSLKKVCNIIDNVLSRDLSLDGYAILKKLSERSGNSKNNMISPIMLHRILNGKASQFWSFIKVKTEEENTKSIYYDKEDEYLKELCDTYSNKIKYIGTNKIEEVNTEEEVDMCEKETISDCESNDNDYNESIENNENNESINENNNELSIKQIHLEKYKHMTLDSIRDTDIYKMLKEKKIVNTKTSKKKLLQIFENTLIDTPI
jgi:hypothetical protein